MTKRITVVRIDFNQHGYSGKISNHQMTFESTSRFLDVRRALVVAALLSLCVSNNVGPCFLPLPVVTERIAESRQTNRHDKASPTPSPAQSESFRVPIMAQTQKRGDNEHYPQPVATTLKAGFVVPEDARAATEFSYPISILTSASVSQPPGRAPPRLS